MKTLILSVDRDDDLGDKAKVATPVIGRRRCIEAATALGLADPEDSDTNALFSAVKMYDRESDAGGGRQVEVAAIAGHRRVGLRSDRILAAQLEQVIELTQPDDIVLVSDGAEDEQILPIITSRIKVAHVHRSVVKQAPRLEGFYMLLTRMLDDDKLAKRFVLPFALVMFVWGIAFLLQVATYAWGLTFLIVGGWLGVHAMRWEQRLSRFMGDVVEGMRAGKVGLVANLVAIMLIVVGIGSALQIIQGQGSGRGERALLFSDAFLFYAISAVLVHLAGRIFDDFMRRGKASLRLWTTGFMFIAFGFIGSVAIDFSLAYMNGQALTRLLNIDFIVRLFVGLAVAMAGIIVGKYVRTFFDEAAAPPSR